MLLGKDRIKVNQKALGSSSGSAFMKIGDSDQTHSIRSNSQNELIEGPKVKLETIDTYLAKERIASIDLLKIDVEGYELEVLREPKTPSIRFHSINLRGMRLRSG